MSLTSFVKTPQIRKQILADWPIPAFSLDAPIIAPPTSEKYALIGTAFDYLLRFYIKKHNSNVIEKVWVAESASISQIFFPAFAAYAVRKGIDKSRSDTIGFELMSEIKSILKKAKNDYQEFISGGKLNDDLLKSIIKLARLDAVYRAGWIDENLSVVDQSYVKDLKALYGVIPPAVFQKKKTVLLNPIFPRGSEMVGGADCDIILDDELIDIKTTKKLEMTGEHWVQLIGYAVLADIANESSGQFPKPKKVGIYFSRHGVVWTYPTDTIYNDPKYPSFRRWFEDEAKKMFG